MKISKVNAWRTPRPVLRVRHDGKVLWSHIAARYVSLGDSIAAGHTINAAWEKDYGTGSQYGENGNQETEIVPGCYTDLLRRTLTDRADGRVLATSFAHSGDKVSDLIEKLDHDAVRRAISRADYVTVCIGANDVLGPVERYIETYINTGDLSGLAATVEQNLAILADDTHPMSYAALFDKLRGINAAATYVFTTIYNPYKYLWIDDGTDGFFAPLLNTIPSMNILGFDVGAVIKNGLLNTSMVQTLFSRVNGLAEWSERFVTKLNDVLRSKIAAYSLGKFLLADSKAVFDPVPDRPITAPKHYNDLVNVEYTRGYDTMQMDWGRLYDDSGGAATFWLDLATKYVSLSGVDLEGLAAELVQLMIEKVIMPDVDPHPEEYGHHALEQSFADVLGWSALPRRVITFYANGGVGTMDAQTVIALDGYTAYANLRVNEFGHTTEGYHFNGWHDLRGTAYTDGQFIGLDGDLSLYAQWTNLFQVTYMHTNHTNGVYGLDETGHQECYAMYINGELKPKFGTFAAGSTAVYTVPYGSTIRVVVSNYNPSELVYDDVDCDVYWNGVSVSTGYRGTEYSFSLPGSVVIDFQWKIAGSLATLDARSWEDCYITTQ